MNYVDMSEEERMKWGVPDMQTVRETPNPFGIGDGPHCVAPLEAPLDTGQDDGPHLLCVTVWERPTPIPAEFGTGFHEAIEALKSAGVTEISLIPDDVERTE